MSAKKAIVPLRPRVTLVALLVLGELYKVFLTNFIVFDNKEKELSMLATVITVVRGTYFHQPKVKEEMCS